MHRVVGRHVEIELGNAPLELLAPQDMVCDESQIYRSEKDPTRGRVSRGVVMHLDLLTSLGMLSCMVLRKIL